MASRRRASPLLWLLALAWALSARPAASQEFTADGTVIELDDSNLDSAIAAFDYILVDFYAPWCGHCKRLAPELDEAAPQLAGLSQPIVIAKIDADKYRKVTSKYEIDGYPTLKLFMHGVPIEYTGSRKAELLVRFLKKFVAPDVSLLDSDSSIRNFVETAGTDFPIFIGFGLNESSIVDFASKYKRKAWFSVAKDFSEEVMIAYDFDKVPAIVSLHPKYNEQSVFYGPFEGEFLEDFIQQNQLPLTVPINHETLKLLTDDKRKIILAIVEDVFTGNSVELVKVLRSAATANRDLVFGYVGLKQWEEFVDTFDINKKSKFPQMLVWDGDEDYHIVVGAESLDEEDNLGSQISRFLEGYKEGRTIKKKLSGPSLLGFINSLISIRTVYIIVFIVAVLVLIQSLARQDAYAPQMRASETEVEDMMPSSSKSESHKEEYQPGDKED